MIPEEVKYSLAHSLFCYDKQEREVAGAYQTRVHERDVAGEPANITFLDHRSERRIRVLPPRN